MPYREDVEGQDGAELITPRYLQARSMAHGWADFTLDKDDTGKIWSRHLTELPEQATIASLKIDVQDNRCYWSLIGADPDLRTWDASWGYEFATPDQLPMSEPELHAVLDRIRDLLPSLITRVDGAQVLVVTRGVDVGFHQEEITNWLVGNPTWVPLSGAGDEVAGKLRQALAKGDMLGVVYRREIVGARLGPRQLLHLVDVDKVKEQAQTAFLRTPGDAGAAHLPRGLKANDAYVLHLTAEVLEEDEKSGRRKWRVVRKRNDYLDLRTYHLALLRLHLRNLTLPTNRRRFGVVGNIGG
jgi:hypothetical protein